MNIKDKYARVYLTHLAAPISPAAWRHLSPGDILFAASGIAGSWPESERTVPPELLACSFLPAAPWLVNTVRQEEVFPNIQYIGLVKQEKVGPESERTVPLELLACSFLPAAVGHISSVR